MLFTTSHPYVPIPYFPYSHDPRQKADLKEHYHLAYIIYHN